MPFVVDASVAACWLLPDERHSVAETAFQRIAHDPAVAPSLWWYELRNILIVSERRGRLDTAATARALRLLGRLPITSDAAVEEEALLQLARRHRLTVYDAAYLELAQRMNMPLATLDAELAIAARAENVRLIGDERT
ncbi:MAG TPA: type II toxin-antitoxin system VapC family toxin [Beijerinckiaceae bacterium]|jgi:predicted nucleic acid-binding protein|nr:type II toxin-antitoxin system VapC family toxin [Beijerinckiaceae bacterium]